MIKGLNIEENTALFTLLIVVMYNIYHNKLITISLKNLLTILNIFNVLLFCC